MITSHLRVSGPLILLYTLHVWRAMIKDQLLNVRVSLSLKVQNASCFCNKISVLTKQWLFSHHICIVLPATLNSGSVSSVASQQIKIASLPSRPSKTSLKGRSQLKDQTMGLGPPAWQQYSSNLLSSVLSNLSQLSDLSIVNISVATLHWS